MKIVVTDGYTLNPGDLSWETMAAFGELIVHDRTAAKDIEERCREATIVFTNKVPFSREALEKLPHLKLVSVLATGYNIIDVQAAKEKGITVCNVPAYGTASVAQHTISLLLELTNKAGVHAASVAAGDWQCSPNFSYTKAPLTELNGKTMGIVGLGNIGLQTAAIAKALGMHILYTSRTKRETDLGTYVDIKSLFINSDVVSLHCPLTAANHQFVNKELLQLMKPTAFLLNTARGQLLHEQDVADALNSGQIAGAALDVLSVEPPPANNPLLKARNCIITPHNAWMSKEARQRIMEISVENLEAYLAGKPINVVSV